MIDCSCVMSFDYNLSIFSGLAFNQKCAGIRNTNVCYLCAICILSIDFENECNFFNIPITKKSHFFIEWTT